MNNRVYSFFIVILLLFITLPSWSKAQIDSEDEQAGTLIFLIDALSFDRFRLWMEKSPPFQMWVQQSEIGAMTMRTGSGRSIHNQLVTLATGVKTSAPKEVMEFEPLDGAEGAISYAYGQWLHKQNKLFPFGELMKKSGRTIEVIGNSDLWNQKRSLASTFVSDREGKVYQATIDDRILQGYVEHPFLMLSDYEMMKDVMKQSDANVIVVDIADIRRVQQVADRYDDESQREWVNKVDSLIIDLLLWTKDTFPNHSLWLISPSIDRAAEREQKWLTPILHYSSNARAESIFYSPTTRQPGIVANVDVLPTLLHRLGIALPIGIEGRPLEHREGRGLHEQVFQRVDELFYIHHLRPDLLYQVISLQVIVLIVVGLMALQTVLRSPIVMYVSHYLLIYVLMVPFFLLLLGAFIPKWGLFPLHLYLLLGGFVVAFLLRKQKISIVYSFITLVYVILLFIDGIMDNYMMKRSFLGYDPLIGARYYGIGNEYMGVLIGSSLLFFFLLYERLKETQGLRTVVLVLFHLSILFYLAAPNGGTNAGGTMAWLGAIVLTIRYLFPMLWRGRWMWLTPCIALCLFIVFLLLQFFYGEQTHIGRLLHHIVEGGFEPLWEMMRRKWEMNVRLIRGSTWSKLFVTSVILLVLFWMWPKRKHTQKKSGLWKPAFRTIVWVSMINLLVNDSGVVAAACSLLFAAVPLLHLVLKERVTSAPTPPSSSPTL